MDGHPVGVVGVGIIGRAIAETLLARGVDVLVHDRAPHAVAGLPAHSIAGSVAAVAGRCPVLLVAVQDDDQVAAVVEEALTATSAGSVVVVHSTVLPATVQRLGALAAAHGVELLDAPLAGTGEAGVRGATIWALVGGSPAPIDRVQPLFERYTGRVLRTGALGSGAALKLAHNVFVYLGYRAVQEAHDLARAAGVADGLLAEVTTASGMMSPSFRVYHDIYEHRVGLADGEREPGPFATYAAILEKDLRQAVEVASGLGVALPVAEVVRHRGAEIYRV